MKYGLHNKLSATEGNGQALAAILLEAAELVSAHSYLYMVSQDSEHPEDVWVTEVWESKEAHDISLQDEKVKALIAKAMPLLAGMPEKGQELQVLGGAGLE